MTKWRASIIRPHRQAGCLRGGGGGGRRAGATRQGEFQGVREGTRKLTSGRELEDGRERLSPASAAAAAAHCAVPRVETESKLRKRSIMFQLQALTASTVNLRST